MKIPLKQRLKKFEQIQKINNKFRFKKANTNETVEEDVKAIIGYFHIRMNLIG